MDDRLAPEERAILEQLIAAREARERVPIALRSLVRHPEKYAFPVGLDDEGTPFRLPPPAYADDGGGEPA